MPRAKGGFKTRRRRNRVLEQAKGFRLGRRSIFSVAKNSVRRALSYQYRDRRNKKREFRRLWIVRINAAAHTHGLTYSQLIHSLKLANIEIDRKVLSDMAIHDPAGFGEVVAAARQAAPPVV
jgi:large subunit ribosomal protein L20